MIPALRDHLACGILEAKFYCMNWPMHSGCGATWSAPVVRFDLLLTVDRLEQAAFCPFCRSDRIQVDLVRPAAFGAPVAFPGRH